MLFLPALKGLLFMLSVIVAIGPQNAFLLRQAVRREHAWLTAGIFLFGDATMVALGGFGIGHVLERWAILKLTLTVLGALYILWFAFGVLRQVMKPKTLVAEAGAADRNILGAALAVTFLNPHAIFDTVVFVGTLALQFQGHAKLAFMAGAICGSSLWFFGIAWAGQRLAPFLSRPKVWRVINATIFVIMLVMAAMLGIDAYKQGLALASP